MTTDTESLAAPFHAIAGSGLQEVWWIGGRVSIKATGAQTGGRLGTWEFHARRGAATPMHVHHREDEYFVVVEGTASFFVGDERFDASSGDFVFLPREIPHAYLITSEWARVIGMVTPAGHESFFTELGTPVVPGEPEAPPPSVEAMAAGMVRHGGEILGPPPTLE